MRRLRYKHVCIFNVPMSNYDNVDSCRKNYTDLQHPCNAVVVELTFWNLVFIKTCEIFQFRGGVYILYSV